MRDENLKDQSTHFAFGKNWASYSNLIGDAEVEEACRGLLKLVPKDELMGRSFLDIGCGSGLHALAATRCGVAAVTAIDIDPDSAATARRVLENGAVAIPWEVKQASVFDFDPRLHGTFDVVYSWGVLHHTGALTEAVSKAAGLVKPGGLIAMALYRRTRMDWFWRAEKRLYARSSVPVQRLIRRAYIAAFAVCWTLTGRNFREYVAKYRTVRGMDWFHDVDDWLGGYPYETILSSEVQELMHAEGFEPIRVFSRPLSLGLLGSGCDEYVYRRIR